MKLYCPMAEYAEDKPSILGNKLFTYEAELSMAEAEAVIVRWEKECGFHLTKAWVDVFEGAELVESVLFDLNRLV